MDHDHDKEEEARRIVRNFSFGNAALGLIPVPIFDLVALTGVQVKMVHSLSNLYGVKFSKDALKGTLISLAGSLGSMTLAGGLFLSAIKFIPTFGMATAGLMLPACSAAFTYAVGRCFIMHFEAGGNVLNFDADAMHEYFRKFYKDGLEKADKKEADKKEAAKTPAGKS